MPNLLKKACAYNTCPNTTDKKYCDKHKSLKSEYVVARGTTTQQGYGTIWQKIRKIYLSANPLCVKCEKDNKIVPATEVDHIMPLKRGGTNEETNLQGLCKPCHSRKTRLQGRL